MSTPPNTTWQPVAPVPSSAPVPSFAHFLYPSLDAVWEYVFNRRRYGYVVRFRDSSGAKQLLPYTWCADASGERSPQWRWKQWDEPRPLYAAGDLLLADSAQVPVVLVEGEKCALAGHMLLGREFDFVTWPSGPKAWRKANWQWLQGRLVYLWADCDAQRDPHSNTLRPAAMQPGVAAMLGIGALLAERYGCTVMWCPVPKPGATPNGWDIADAIAQGWDADALRTFIRSATAFVPLDRAVPF